MSAKEELLRGKMLASSNRIQSLRASLELEQDRWLKLFAALSAVAKQSDEKARSA
jgi:hypothetical protein